MLLLLLSPAWASHVVQVSEQIPLDENGTFARPFLQDGDWYLGFGAGQGFWISPLLEAPWALPPRDQAWRLTPESQPMRDFALRRCPDESWLLLGSADTLEPDDSAYAYTFEADWSPRGSATVAEGVGGRSHNDMTTVCSGPLMGSFFPSDDGGVPRNWFVHLDEDGAPIYEVAVAGEPRMTGGGAAWDPERRELVTLGFALPDELLVVVYDEDLNTVDEHAVLISDAPERAYWPQGALLIEDTWVVAYMLRDDETWAAGDEGDLGLAFFDRDWTLKERLRLTSNPLDGGGQRPWLAQDGERLLVAYDRQQELTLIDVTLDLRQFSAPEDTGFDPGDTADTGAPLPPAGCRCSQGSLTSVAGGWLLGLGLLLGLRRRRRA